MKIRCYFCWHKEPRKGSKLLYFEDIFPPHKTYAKRICKECNDAVKAAQKRR